MCMPREVIDDERSPYGAYFLISNGAPICMAAPLAFYGLLTLSGPYSRHLHNRSLQRHVMNTNDGRYDCDFAAIDNS